jgi:hypothetical protein
VNATEQRRFVIQAATLTTVLFATPALAQVSCSAQVEGEQVFIDCADGSHFEAPARGGRANGFDRRGNDLDAYVTLSDGRYSVSASGGR